LWKCIAINGIKNRPDFVQVRAINKKNLSPGYLKRDKSEAGAWLACASMEIAVCCKIWNLLAFTCSSAKLASMIRLKDVSTMILAVKT